jgi:hypothetical protein
MRMRRQIVTRRDDFNLEFCRGAIVSRSGDGRSETAPLRLRRRLPLRLGRRSFAAASKIACRQAPVSLTAIDNFHG